MDEDPEVDPPVEPAEVLYWEEVEDNARRKTVWFSDDPEAVKTALENGYNPNYCDNTGSTALHKSAQHGCLNSLKAFLDAEITRTDVMDHMNHTALHSAALCEEFDAAVEATKLLLGVGLDINAESNDVDNPTPLFLAVYKKNIKLAAFLLENGADIDLKNFSDLTILANLLLTFEGLYFSPVEKELITEFISLLLYYNVDVNYPFNAPAFYLAAFLGADNVCHLLFNYFDGYDYHIEGQERYRPCQYALDTFKFCVRMGFDVDQMFDLVQKLQFEPDGLVESLLCTGVYEDPKLFNYLSSKLSCVQNGSKDYNLSFFLQYNKLPRKDFVMAMQKLLNVKWNIQWSQNSFDYCYYVLLTKIMDEKRLSQDDLILILHQMFLASDEVSAKVMQRLFRNGGFSDEFEIFLRQDLLLYDLNYISPRRHRPGGLSAIFKQICFPSSKQCGEIGVKSLQCLSRDVIRCHFKHQVRLEEISKIDNEPKKCFQYYNEVQKLDVPLVIKDIITLKRRI